MLKGGEKRGKRAGLARRGWCDALKCDVRFPVFHLSSPLSAPSLELRLFIRGGGEGSWIPQCEIGRDANPDRLVIKKPLESKRRQRRRGGVRGRAREGAECKREKHISPFINLNVT